MNGVSWVKAPMLSYKRSSPLRQYNVEITEFHDGGIAPKVVKCLNSFEF